MSNSCFEPGLATLSEIITQTLKNRVTTPVEPVLLWRAARSIPAERNV
jgi:hypothetical protein